MSFGEKLTKLRKEKGMSQEDLANNLNVSRQAVSKWESNSSYPETEKIIAICKLFDCSMDELIGIKERINKQDNKVLNIFNKYFDMFIKGIKMFYSMTFTQKIKCLFEMCFYALILLILFFISIYILSEIVRKLFYLLPNDLLIILIQVFEGLYYLVYLVISIYILIKLYKVRYLDYYNNYLEEKKTTLEKVENQVVEKINIKEEKIIIRDKDDDFKPFSWLKKICLLLLKSIIFFMSIALAITLVIFIALSIFFLSFISSGILLLYITICILASSLGIYIILEIFIKFIFNLEQKPKRLFAMFIISLSILGISSGLFACELTKYEIIDNVEYNSLLYKETINMKDNLIIDYINYYNTEVSFVNREDILVEFYGYDKDLITIKTYNDNKKIYNSSYDINHFYITPYYEDKTINEIISDTLVSIEDKKIIMNDLLYDVEIKIYISEENYHNILENKEYYYTYWE